MGRMTWCCIALFYIAGCGAKNSYLITVEPQGTKIVIGKFTPSVLISDSSFLWYSHNYDAFTPDSASIAFLSTAAKDIRFVVVGGTWCSDTKRELPKFFKVVSLAHLPESNIDLYGVDRSKKSKEGLTEKYGINRVPTFILLFEGKEVGRIVESTREGMEFDLVGLLRKK